MWEAIRANKRRSFLLISALGGVLIALGYLVGASFHPRGWMAGIVVAVTLWLILTVTATLSGRRLLLGSVGARRIEHDDYPLLFNVVEEMTIASGLPKMPEVYILDSDAPNAFAVGGEEESAVAVTTGLLMRLSRDELQGVVAHEIGHVVNNDTRYMTLAGVLVAAIVLISDVFLRSMVYGGRRRRGRGKGAGLVLVVALVFAILAPIIARLLYLACSRRREYLADACSARFSRYPEGLASALEKISAAAGRMKKVNRAVAPMFTVNPLKASGGAGLLSTHPPTSERVKVLRAMAGGADYAAYENAYAEATGDHLIGSRTLSKAERSAVREPSAEPEKGDLEKAREVVDILHRLNGLVFITCACGLRTKVPPNFEQDEIRCPRCGRVIPMAAVAGMAAAGAAEEGETLQPVADGNVESVADLPEEELVFQCEGGKWQSFQCSCGETIQLSPSFSAPRVECPGCGRTIPVEHAGG